MHQRSRRAQSRLLGCSGSRRRIHLLRTEGRGLCSCLEALIILVSYLEARKIIDQIRQFDVTRPGRESWTHELPGQTGIISSIAVHPSMPVLAAGCYNKTTGLYSVDGQLLCLLTGQAGGVTQVKLSEIYAC